MTEPPLALSVLVPVGPDASDLLELYAELAAELSRSHPSHEFLYLVQGPAGALLETVLGLQEKDPERVRVLSFGQRVGEAELLRAGHEASRGRVLLTVPAYFEVDTAELPELCGAVEAGADLAVASRSAWHDPGWAQSRLFNRLVAWATGAHFSDLASRTRALRRELLDEVHLYGDIDRYLPVLAHRMGFSVRERAARKHPRTRAPLLHTPGTYLWRALDVLSIFFLARFTRHPLRLFGGVGSVFGALGALVLALAVLERFTLSRPLADRPVLVLGTLLIGLGVQLFTIGLLGELILFFHARSIRDYRIAAIYEASPPALPDPRHGL
jgi:hypothetical protein